MKSYCLTTPQKNIWNLQKYYSDTAISNLCGAIIYPEKRDIDRLRQAVDAFIQGQSAMRLRFCENKEPVQYISQKQQEKIPFLKFETEEEFDQYAETFAKKPIGLAERVMYRFMIFELQNRNGILFVMSHLIADAWTFSLMADQVDTYYHALMRGEEPFIQQTDYTDFINEEEKYFRSDRFQSDHTYWKNKLGIYETSRVKLSADQSYPAAERITRKLPFELERKIESFCERNSVTQAVVFELMTILYLCGINSANKSITIGVPVLNRSGVKEKNTAGMFISTVPLIVEVDGNISVTDLAKRIAKEHMGIFRHQKYPYSDMQQMLREKNEFSGNLYDVMVSYQNARTNISAETKWYSNGFSEIPLMIHIDNRDGNDSHTLTMDYQTGVFSGEEAELLLERLIYILDQVTENENKRVREIHIVPPKEMEKITEEFNDTKVDYPRDKCVHELFEEQAEKTPDRTAVVFHEKHITYRQLDGMSDRLADVLREKGIGRGDVVPIMAKRSWHIVLAMLGILKAGAAYMPVSPDYPADRIMRMVDTAGSRIMLCYGLEDKNGIEDMRVETVSLEEFEDGMASAEKTPAVKKKSINKQEDLCYVIFTSGSTGEPKGVSVSHGNVVNYCDNNNNNNVCRRIIKDGYQSIVSVTNFVFDIFVTETLLPLLNGMTVWFADDEQAMRQDKLAGLVKGSQIEVMQTTPTKMRSFMIDKENRDYLRSFKAVVLGGEAFPADLYAELKSCTDASVFNIYGPAETTVWSTNAEVMGEEITIGKPIANTQIYIVGSDGNILPIGAAGELCIAGDGVGLGYLNRPELTAERFVPNPFATEENGHGKIMYRTGDLARWRADGEIEYLGRIDTQVKIRGLRIELGEIESVMAGFPGIALCAATDKKDESGRQYLVGYYTIADGSAGNTVREKELRKYLAEKLPKYMVPNYFMRLDKMPMTPSGKTDRKSLPMPDFGKKREGGVIAKTETEQKLIDIWKKLLNIQEISSIDSFYELGGDSLLIFQLLNEISNIFSVDVTLQELMQNTTLEQLAQCIDLLKNRGNEAEGMAADPNYEEGKKDAGDDE